MIKGLMIIFCDIIQGKIPIEMIEKEVFCDCKTNSTKGTFFYHKYSKPPEVDNVWAI